MQNQEKTNQNKKRNIITAVSICLIIVVVCGVIWGIKTWVVDQPTSGDVQQNEQLHIFENKDAMVTFLKGEWNCTDSKISYRFSENGVVFYKTQNDTEWVASENEVVFAPEKGSITIEDQEFIVKGDALYQDGAKYLHETVTFWDIPTTTTKEEMYRDLQFSDLTLVKEGKEVVCKGTITNNGDSAYTFVIIKCLFQDEDGKKVRSQKACVIADEGIAPGASIPFEIRVFQPDRGEITNAFLSYEE